MYMPALARVFVFVCACVKCESITIEMQLSKRGSFPILKKLVLVKSVEKRANFGHSSESFLKTSHLKRRLVSSIDRLLRLA